MKAASRAFTLVECIAAVSLFALAGVAISAALANLVFPLVRADAQKNDADIELCLAEILKVENYDALDDGIDVDGLGGTRYRVVAEFEPTEVLDLFELKAEISSPEKTYTRRLFVVRPKWYENASDRDELKRDREDFLELKRRNDAFERGK